MEGRRRWVELLAEIRAFQKRHDMPDSRFGRRALNDPHLINDLRRGRELRAATAARVRRFMAERA